jgi:hypothetical protein
MTRMTTTHRLRSPCSHWDSKALAILTQPRSLLLSTPLPTAAPTDWIPSKRWVVPTWSGLSPRPLVVWQTLTQLQPPLKRLSLSITGDSHLKMINGGCLLPRLSRLLRSPLELKEDTMESRPLKITWLALPELSQLYLDKKGDSLRLNTFLSCKKGR